MLEDAIAVANEAHRGQTDRQGDPYIRHALRVMEAVPEEARVVAVLHDVIEDADEEALAPVATRLSDEEAEALRLLTRDRGSYDEYIERIATAGNRLALSVKRADLADNLRPCETCPEHLRPRYLKALERLAATTG